MKPLLLFVSLIFSFTVFSQEDNPEIQDKIFFSPNEVMSSAVINLDFEQPGQFLLKAINKETNKESVLPKIEKGTEKKIIKIDLSYLESGNYFLIIYNDESEIKKINFAKK